MFPSEPPLPADMTHHFNPHQAYALGLHPTTAPNLCPATTSNPIEPCRINFTSLGSAGVSLLDYYKSPAMLDNGNQLVHELISKPVKPLDTLNIKFSVRWNSNMPDRPWLLTIVLAVWPARLPSRGICRWSSYDCFLARGSNSLQHPQTSQDSQWCTTSMSLVFHRH